MVVILEYKSTCCRCGRVEYTANYMPKHWVCDECAEELYNEQAVDEQMEMEADLRRKYGDE